MFQVIKPKHYTHITFGENDTAKFITQLEANVWYPSLQLQKGQYSNCKANILNEVFDQGWKTPGTRTKHGKPVTFVGTQNPLL